MKSRTVIGAGNMLELAWHAWRTVFPGEEIGRREVTQGPDYAFELGAFDGLDPAQSALFVAFDERFSNFKRMELMQAAMDRGFRLESLVSSRAFLGGDVKVGPNVFVGDGAIVGAGAVLDYNSVIHAGAVLGAAVHIRPSCWVESGVHLGSHAEIGAHSILRAGVLVAPGIKIGRCCELGVAGTYRENVAPKTVFDPRYDEPIRVYGG